MNLRKDHYRVLVVVVFAGVASKELHVATGGASLSAVSTPRARPSSNMYMVSVPGSRALRGTWSVDRLVGGESSRTGRICLARRRFKELALSSGLVAPHARLFLSSYYGDFNVVVVVF